MELLRDGALKIWMSEQDMHRWGLCFEQLSAHDRATGAAVTKLLQVARGRAALPEAGTITVEAVPFEGGCMWLFTPGRKRFFGRMPHAKVFALRTADDVLLLGRWLGATRHLPTASLYQWREEYRLILYPGMGTWREFCRRLTEFAEPIGEGAGMAAFVEEYGRPIAVGNALTRLREACQPTRRDRVR